MSEITITERWHRACSGRGGYFAYRALLLLPQTLAVSVVAFALLHMIPGDPAKVILGPLATPDSIERLRSQMGLDAPLWEQYMIYISNALHGDLGISTSTSNSVLRDISSRAVPTLELLTITMVILIAIAMGLGLLSIFRPNNWLNRVARFYSSTAGSFPDFWVALVLLYIFYYLMKLAPPPSGQMDPTIFPPPTVTGSTLIDSVLAGDAYAFLNSAGHLVLPIVTLVIVNVGPVLRMANATFEELNANRVLFFARSHGLPRRRIAQRIIKQSLPPVLTLAGTLYVFLLAGVVVTEQVFSWGGLGQYVVSAVQQSDYFAVLGFLIIASVFTLVVYLVIDVIHALSDPRIQLGRKSS